MSTPITPIPYFTNVRELHLLHPYTNTVWKMKASPNAQSAESSSLLAIIASIKKTFADNVQFKLREDNPSACLIGIAPNASDDMKKLYADYMDNPALQDELFVQQIVRKGGDIIAINDCNEYIKGAMMANGYIAVNQYRDQYGNQKIAPANGLIFLKTGRLLDIWESPITPSIAPAANVPTFQPKIVRVSLPNGAFYEKQMEPVSFLQETARIKSLFKEHLQSVLSDGIWKFSLAPGAPLQTKIQYVHDACQTNAEIPLLHKKAPLTALPDTSQQTILFISTPDKKRECRTEKSFLEAEIDSARHLYGYVPKNSRATRSSEPDVVFYPNPQETRSVDEIKISPEFCESVFAQLEQGAPKISAPKKVASPKTKLSSQ